jgi:hypothetical protein
LQFPFSKLKSNRSMAARKMPLSGPALASIVCLILLAACGFPDGPDWPPATGVPAATAAAAGLQRQESADAGQRISLAQLVAGRPAAPVPGGGAVLVGRVRPLVVIRFGATPLDFEPTLYNAVRGALERRPNSAFDLVALAPGIGAADQAAVTRDSESVLRALVTMGLPVERLSLSAATAAGLSTHEVHIYVR